MIEVFLDGTSIGTTTTLNSSFFTFDYTGTVLADGTYNFTVTATDITSNTSSVSAALTITINSVDTDGDGLPDFCDNDDDGNGVDDRDEDCDGDGIIDSQDTDNSSCTSTITQTKKYGFSPNGDGVNDGWTIENITAYPNSVVQVFNRSAKLVFKKKGYQSDWDGISNQINSSGNNRLPVGPYLFIIDLGNGSTPTRGWIYINY
jgi:gliding motility-associated-like protein